MIPRRIATAAQRIATTSAYTQRSAQISPSSRLRLRHNPASVSQLCSIRRYSQATEESKADEKSSATDSAVTDAPPTDNAAIVELEAKKQELTDANDRWKRSVAEYRNLQEQTKREVQAAKDFAIQRFARDLIDSIDNLDRALTTVPADKLSAENNKELVDLHSGLKMTERILLETVKKHGLERFDPSEKSDKFDPNLHEATFQAPQQGKEDGTVFYTQQKGFLLNGRVLRAAKVGVVKNS